MKYYIVHVLKGEPSSYIKKLRTNIANKFLITSDTESPHITIKYGFKTTRLDELEGIIKNICRNHSRIKCKLSGFNYFEGHTIYVRVIPTKELLIFYKDIYETLNALRWVKWDKFDDEEPLSMHCSVVSNSNGIKDFQEIWDYVSKQKLSYDITIDNLAIIACDKKSWKIVKEFKIRK